MQYIMSFLLAMIVTIACLPVLGRFARQWMIVDRPGLRKVHLEPIPRIGGLAMALGAAVAAMVVVPLERQDTYFLAGAAVLTLFGVLDDRFDLNYRIKFLGQLIAVCIAVIGGGIQIHWITLAERSMLPEWAAIPLTVFFLIGVINAINLADGLDGLAGGTTFLCLCAIALLAHSGEQFICASLALAFAGAVLGFLRFNTFPASVFMGDAGSQLLGFAVGVLSLRATQSGSSEVSAATPILLLALPILDTLSVMVQRMSEGRSPFSPDKNHIHHKLLSLGFDHHEAVMVIYIVQADLFLLAYWMRYESDVLILAVVSFFFLSVILVMQVAARRGWRFRLAGGSQRASPLTRLLNVLRRREHLPRYAYLAVAIGLGMYASLIVAESVSLKGDVNVLLMILLGVTAILLMILRLKPLSIVEKGALYVTASVLVYLDCIVLPPQSQFLVPGWLALGMAAAGMILRLRLANDRRFELTPLDLIVLFAALVVPSLLVGLDVPDRVTAALAKLVILFYSIEVLVNRMEMPVVWLRIAVSALLAGLILRPLLSA